MPEHILPDDQFYVFSDYRAKGWEEVNKEGELVVMRRNTSTSPLVKSYEYIYITPEGRVRKR